MIIPVTIYLDDQRVQLEGSDLESVLTSAKQKLAATGRVVVEVQVDGQSLLGETFEQQRNVPLKDAELRLYSADPHDLAVGTLEQVRGRLDDILDAQRQAAELFQQDQVAQGMAQVGRTIEAWQQVQQAVLSSMQLLGIDLDEKTVDGETLEQIADALIDKLRGLRDLLAAADTVGLADTLGYEWPETVERWDRLITELVKWIEEDSSSNAQ